MKRLFPCLLGIVALAATWGESAQAATTRYYFLAIHNEPFHPDGESRIAAGYEVLRRMVARAEGYRIKLTLMFSAQWAGFLAASPERMREVAGWKARGHEIAGHHHSIWHGNWDGYTAVTPQEAEAARRRGDRAAEPYLGTLEDFMASLRRINPDLRCGCMNDEGFKRALPAAIVVDTCSGFANFGEPGRPVSDVEPEKGRNEYVSVATVGGVERRWLCHFQTTSPVRVEAAKAVFLQMRSGVYGTVNHSAGHEEAAFNAWLDFLHEQDASGTWSRTVSEVIAQHLLPEKAIPEAALLEPPRPTAAYEVREQIRLTVAQLKRRIAERRAAGGDVSEAERLDHQSLEALRRGRPEECLRLLKQALESLGEGAGRRE